MGSVSILEGSDKEHAINVLKVTIWCEKLTAGQKGIRILYGRLGLVYRISLDLWAQVKSDNHTMR